MNECKATYTLPHGQSAEYGCNQFNCVCKGEHEQHFDHYGMWLKNGRRQEVVPLWRAHQELRIWVPQDFS